MNQKYLTVLELNRKIKSLLESDLSMFSLIVKGEISNLVKHSSGHYYFKLKDESSLISCMMFSSNVAKLKFSLKDGDEVLLYGYLNCYEKNGTYQLYATNIEPYGLGKYLLELEKLKATLKSEGLFDLNKKPLPFLPKKVGIITSKTGAAVHDFVTSIHKRFPSSIYIFPCLVQGDEAPKSIIKAIDEALKYDLDVILIGRGGGSFDELKAYNDEALVRKVAMLDIPTVSAVGHTIDKTLIDYVVSKSAITPTDAGLSITPLYDDLIANIEINNSKAKRLMKINLESKRIRLLNLLNSEVLLNKKEVISIYKNKIQGLDSKIKEFIKQKYYLNKQNLIKVNSRLKPSILNITQRKTKIDHLDDQLKTLLNHLLINQRNKLNLLSSNINLLNPLLPLDKGYAIIKDNNNQTITDISKVSVDQIVNIQIKNTVLEAQIKDIKKENNHGKK